MQVTWHVIPKSLAKTQRREQLNKIKNEFSSANLQMCKHTCNSTFSETNMSVFSASAEQFGIWLMPSRNFAIRAAAE